MPSCCHRQTASVLICVTLPTSGLPTCHNLSHYILRLYCSAPFCVQPNIGWVWDHLSNATEPMKSHIFLSPGCDLMSNRFCWEQCLHVFVLPPIELARLPFNWQPYGSSNLSATTWPHSCQLIYCSSGRKFLKSSIKATERREVFLVHCLVYILANMRGGNKENHHDTNMC